ncbi:MAG: malto-oligosyltrehalose synthase, partial [Cyanobacteria bacterium J06631_9]
MRIPGATYRLQFTPDFGFQQAKAIVEYLAQLGITDIYASPVFAARIGSQHGYDVVDPNRLNPELGTQADYEALVDEAHKHGLGWLQDIVPNHMAFNSQNPYLVDVLEHGPSSQYADMFDIDWDSYHDDLNGKAIAPMLGSDYQQCLAAGELQLSYTEDGLKVNYYSLQLPICLAAYEDFFEPVISQLDESDTALATLLLQIKARVLPLTGKAKSKASTDTKRELWSTINASEQTKQHVEQTLANYNGEAGNSESFTQLDSLLSKQFYQLAHWKTALTKLNYRRFFTVNELICLNAQHPHVFGQTHDFIQKLVKSGKIDGLRVDHVDGLYDPLSYLQRLTEATDNAYILVEKILEADEKLPDNWPIQGTSGYEFLTCVNRVFCQGESEPVLDKFYRQFTGIESRYERLFFEKKRLLAETELVGDIDNLVQRLIPVVEAMGEQSLVQDSLRDALKETMIAFPVYRSYISEQGRSEADVHYIQEAVKQVKESLDEQTAQSSNFLAALAFIEKVLLLDEAILSPEVQALRLRFILRFQQFTGPLTAKGIEDTLFYVYNRFAGLNEVGGVPGEFALSLEAFHAYNQYQQAHWPHNLNASSTHDTKRSEDVRSRLSVLSEIPEIWTQQVTTWRGMNADKKKASDKQTIPDRNDEYFLYQTLVGAYPFDEQEMAEFCDRIKAYVIKAAREAKVNTSWTASNEAYEQGYIDFIDTLLAPGDDNSFLASLRTFQNRIRKCGVYNALSQLLIKLTAPGVPDFYQGSELWDLSLVDPDNRRPVDYAKRANALSSIQEQWQQDPTSAINRLLENWDDGQLKLFFTMQGLATRREFSEVFKNGDYVPLAVTG